MKVKRLKMHAFRGIDELTLDFDQKVTVLIGINGVGKSSILDCLSILFSRFIVLMQIGYNDEDLNQEYQESHLYNQYGVLHIAVKEKLNIRLLDELDIKSKYNRLSTQIKVAIEQEEVEWTLSKIKEKPYQANKDDLLYELGRSTFKLSQKWRTLPHHSIPLVAYYSVDRNIVESFPQSSQFHHIPQVAAYENALAKGSPGFIDFFKWFKALEDLENEERRDYSDYRDNRLEAIRNALPAFFNEQLLNLRIRRSPLRMTVSKNGQELVINQLSDGEKCLLAMVGDIARRLAIANPGLDDPLQGEGVILIDEIELHLHPQWQRRVIPSLTRTFPNCQFIVTTHSPQVLGEVQGTVYRLRSTHAGIVADSLQTYGRDSSHILEDEMEADARSVSVKRDLQKLFRFIDDGNLEAARQLQQNLEHLIGEDEPEFAKADVLIRRKEILGR